MNISLNKDELKLTFRYDHRLVALVKALPARRYAPQEKAWYIPLVGSMEHVEKLAQWGFEIDLDTYTAVKGTEDERREIEELRTQDDAVFASTLPLFPYQNVGARFLTRAKSALLADEVGLGKTIQTLAVIQEADPESVLILCPAILKYQWEAEIRKFLPGWDVQVIDGTAMERRQKWIASADIYIANYELLMRDFEHVAGTEWDIVVADEATRIANPLTKTYKALQKVSARRRIALTGTPVSNRPDEIWGIVNWLAPGVLGNYLQFIERYCVRNFFGGIASYKNLEELNARIKRFMIRRKKEDVLKELPAKIISDVPFALSDNERALYVKLRKELLHEIEAEDISKLENPITIQNTLTKMLRLRQVANSLELVSEKTESSKLELLRGLLQEFVENGRKTIIFTFFAGMADILERELVAYAPLKITGDTLNENRQDIIDMFNKDEKYKVLVMTSAGQFGLNIQAASVIVHYDQEWSLAKMEQREGRAHRIGQDKTVLVYNLLAKGTIDEYVAKIVRGKQKLSDSVLGDGVTVADITGILTYGEER